MVVKLDKNLFTKTLKVVGVRVEAKKIGKVVKALHGHLLNRPRLRNVIPDPNLSEPIKTASSKLILLNEKVTNKETLDGLSNDLIEFLRTESLDFVEHKIELDYTYFPVEYILSRLLPEGIDIPSSFESIGHIAHLNLRDVHLPYKHLIGQVILDKNRHIRTVVNKIENIETKFRTFPMEILAGDDDMNVEVHESKAIFRFNYAQVYWNSRLQQEHLRIIRQFDPKKDIICDMMCGIGPFAIPLALRGCQVFANDLNPKSYEFLNTNIKLNKIPPKQIQTFNLDGRKFILQLLREKIFFTQVLMNLPAIALEFLDVFSKKFDPTIWTEEKKLPWIHCYCFSNAEDPEKDVLERAEKILGGKLIPAKTKFHQVRDVAPKKVMMCLSFQLPGSIAYCSSSEQKVKEEDRNTKKRKTE